MLFRLVNAEYDRHTERGYVEFRANDDDGGEIVANEKDFIFEDQGGADTLVSVTEEGGSYLASLVVGVDRAG